MTLHSAHFAPWEVAPGLHKEMRWEDPQASMLGLDPRLLPLGDAIRDLLCVPCLINDYAIGGTREFCGIRTPRCPQYSPGSWHSISSAHLCGALDLHPQGMPADDARELIRKAVASGSLPDLGGLELGVSWVHVDVRPRVNGHVLEFRA